MTSVMIIACPHCKQNILDKGSKLKPKEQESILLTPDCNHIIHGSCIDDIFLQSPKSKTKETEKDKNEIPCPFPGCQKTISKANTQCIKPFCEFQWLQAQLINEGIVSSLVEHNEQMMSMYMKACSDLTKKMTECVHLQTQKETADAMAAAYKRDFEALITQVKTALPNFELVNVNTSPQLPPAAIPTSSLETESTSSASILSSYNAASKTSVDHHPPDALSHPSLPTNVKEKCPPWVKRNKAIAKDENTVMDNNVKIGNATMKLVEPEPHPSSFSNAATYYQKTMPSAINLGDGIVTQQVTNIIEFAKANCQQKTGIPHSTLSLSESSPAKKQCTDLRELESGSHKQENNVQLLAPTLPHESPNVVKEVPILKFMAPFLATGSHAYHLDLARYGDNLVFFANEHLLIGDGYVHNIVKTAVSSRNYKAEFYKTKFYRSEMTILDMMDLIDSMPELPTKLILAVGSKETRNPKSVLDKLVQQYKKLLKMLHSKGVRALIILPTILYPNALPIRNKFNGALMRQASTESEWDYLYAGGIMNVERIDPPTVSEDNVSHKPQDNRKLIRFLLEITDKTSNPCK